MPRLSTVLVLVILAGTARAGAFEDGLSTFRAAAATTDAAKSRELYRSAAETWEALFRDGFASTRLLTNIGNARAFAGDTGEAVLAYRRALEIDPDNDRARDALDALRLELGVVDRDDHAGSGFLHALFFWHDTLSANTRLVLFALTWIGGFALLYLARWKRRLRAVAVVTLVVAVAMLASLLVTERERRSAGDAVLLVRTEGRSGDGDFYSPSHTAPLPAGVELEVLERRQGDGGWIHGKLRDGTTTWLPASTVETVAGRR